MENIKPFLKELSTRSVGASFLYRRNVLKEYLQVLALDFIYSGSQYRDLIFYGGSCLAQCHGLPRLSEDLDFVDLKGTVKIAALADDLSEYFNKQTDLPVVVTAQKFRVYLKFPVLKELGLSGPGESDQLFLKVEIFSGFDFCQGYKIETLPLFKYNRSLILKSFDLPTLMSTKIRAVLLRQWTKSKKGGEVVVRGKGRDYFDLLWYLQKGIKPNLTCIGELPTGSKDVKTALLAMVGHLDERSISLDLEPLFLDEHFVGDLSRNLKEMLLREISEKL